MDHPVPENGVKSVHPVLTGPGINREVAFTCNEGYVLRGSPHRACVDGEWTGTDPQCVGE